ncbi:MAG: PilZ domain-containing protein [Bdellovibrionota bacterium]
MSTTTTTTTTQSVSTRRHDRYDVHHKIRWDFFASATGGKTGYLGNISQSGCLLKTTEPIEHRRWVRILIHDPEYNVAFTAVGRVVRRENVIEVFNENEATLYRYGVEFTFPAHFSLEPALILALSSKNFSTESCRSLNSKSSFLPGFLA